MMAFDTDAGAVLWDTELPSLANGSTRLALTNGASLVFAGQNGIYALFAGKTRPASAAPWPRAQGGDNRNHSAALQAP